MVANHLYLLFYAEEWFWSRETSKFGSWNVRRIDERAEALTGVFLGVSCKFNLLYHQIKIKQVLNI